MKLNKKIKALTTSLLLISTTLMGCANTANSNDEKQVLSTNQEVSVDNRSQLQIPSTQDEAIQAIQSEIESLESRVETLSTENVRLLEESEQYEKIISQNQSNLLTTAKSQTQIKRLEEQLTLLKQDNSVTISSLKEEIEGIEENIKELNQVVSNKEQLSLINKNEVVELTKTVDGLSQLIEKTNSEFINYQNSADGAHASDLQNLWIGLIILIIITLGLLVSFVLFRKTTKAEISATKYNLDSECNKLDLKLTELLESQVETMALLQTQSVSDDQKNVEKEKEHSIPLKVLTELHRMKSRLAAMPQDTKGLKPLEKAVGRIEESLFEKGYEMINLLDQTYLDGMTINQEYLFDENLSADERIISKVVKPQINFNGVITQVADVIVSIGE